MGGTLIPSTYCTNEYVEVTPKSLRLRKIYLNENDRKRYEKEFK
ncbi:MULTISPECIES: hypothetical protein [Capnocytophaga]|nr:MULTISPECIES: hypothetical protein [Capnocytophaga]